MKELQPVKFSEIITFSLATQECLDNITSIDQNEAYCSALISDSGKFVYLAKGGLLEMINLPSGKRISACNFSSINCQRTITCFSLYQNKLLVGLKCNSNISSGILCVYDPGVSRVIAAISIPSSPSSICVIKESGGVYGDVSFLSVSLKCFFGAAAVGTVDGHLYLTDLRSDETAELFSISSPSSILVIDPAEIGDIIQLRDKARVTDKYCAVDLAASMCSYKTFKYVSPSGKILKVSSSESCGVTALEFVKQAIQLVVGFNFGCFQVWSLEHLQLLYSSDIGLNLSPVTHLVTQEPDDDPRHCFYLWVGRSPLQSQQSITSPTSLELFQMLYEKKETKKNYGVIYKDLECVMSRFEHKLTSDVHHLVDSRTPGSRIITFKSLDGDLSLCYILWEAPTGDGGLSCHLGVFDINRWYQKQLPPSIRQAMYGRMEPLCPFFIFYSMTDIAEKFLPVGLVDIFIDGCSWNNFRSVAGPQSEQFYWPSSSSFKAVCVSETGCIFAEMLGTQRQILADIHQLGTDTFLESQELVQSCWVTGLLNNFDIRRADNDKRNTEALLTLSLEHGDLSFITSCIRKWSHGSVTHAGYSIKLIYDWAWNQVVQHKKDLDEFHPQLFNSISEELEEETICSLKKNSVELQFLVEIFKEIERAKALTLDEGEKELKTRTNIVSYLSLYCDVLLLLIDGRVLPELDQKIKKSSRKISYPFEVLNDFYDARRIENSEKEDSNLSLLIDLMLDNLEPINIGSRDQIEDETKLNKYPPFSIEIMCSFFLQNLSEDESPLLLFYYWILDLCECVSELQTNKTSEKIKECLKLSQNSSILVQSFWLLDHKLYAEAVESLTQFNMAIPCIYYVHIVRLLYKQQQTNLLLAFCSCKEPSGVLELSDIKYIVKVFLNLKMLSSAYKFQSLYSNQSIKEQVFYYFLLNSKSNGLLGKLICLSLSTEEEIQFQTFLESSEDNNSYLMVFYLEKRMYSKAIELSKKLKNINTVKLDHVIQDQINTQCLLVGGFVKMLPHSQQKRIYNLKTLNNVLNFPDGNLNPHSTPLSTIIKKSQNSYPSAELSMLYKTYHQVAKIDSSGRYFSNQKRRKVTLFDSEVISPSKKSKDMPIEKISQQPIGLARRHLYSGSDAYLLLKTPPARQIKKIIQSTTAPSKTPQSILKPLNKTIVQTNESNTDTSRKTLFQLPEQTPSRKIRFVGFSSPNTISPMISPFDAVQHNLCETSEDSFSSSVKSEIQVSSPNIAEEKTMEVSEYQLEQKLNESNNDSFVSFDTSYSMSINEILDSLSSKKPEYKSDINLKERLHETDSFHSSPASINLEESQNDALNQQSFTILPECHNSPVRFFDESPALLTALPLSSKSSKELVSDSFILLSSSDEDSVKDEESVDHFSADETELSPKFNKSQDESDCFFESLEEQTNMHEHISDSAYITINEESIRKTQKNDSSNNECFNNEGNKFNIENNFIPSFEETSQDTNECKLNSKEFELSSSEVKNSYTTELEQYSSELTNSCSNELEQYPFKVTNNCSNELELYPSEVSNSFSNEFEQYPFKVTNNCSNELEQYSPKVINIENVKEDSEVLNNLELYSHDSLKSNANDFLESSTFNVDQSVKCNYDIDFGFEKSDNAFSFNGCSEETKKELLSDNNSISINCYTVKQVESLKEVQNEVFLSEDFVNDVEHSESCQNVIPNDVEHSESCQNVIPNDVEHSESCQNVIPNDVEHSESCQNVILNEAEVLNKNVDVQEKVQNQLFSHNNADIEITESSYKQFYFDSIESSTDHLSSRNVINEMNDLIAVSTENGATLSLCNQSPGGLKDKQKVNKLSELTPLRRSARKSVLQNKTQTEATQIKRNLIYSDEPSYNLIPPKDDVQTYNLIPPKDDVQTIIDSEQLSDSSEKIVDVEINKIKSTEQIKKTRRTTGRRLKNEQYLSSNVEVVMHKMPISELDIDYKRLGHLHTESYVDLMQPLQIIRTNEVDVKEEPEIQFNKSIAKQEKMQKKSMDSSLCSLSEVQAIKTPKKSLRTRNNLKKEDTGEKSYSRTKAKDLEKMFENNDDVNQTNEDELNRSMNTSYSLRSLQNKSTPSKYITRNKQKQETPIFVPNINIKTQTLEKNTSPIEHKNEVPSRRYTRSSFGRIEHIEDPLLALIETGLTSETTSNKKRSRLSSNARVNKNSILNFEIDKDVNAQTPKRVAKNNAKPTEILPRRSTRRSALP
ncbi:protein ELYS isoform X2 [Hydra vulgaris]|uniref:Protein ELYS isoform X2 n=1 Tax=Hydra vulgaris TaxID=6087 RepID=A0ABM4D2H2_HYDVU